MKGFFRFLFLESGLQIVGNFQEVIVFDWKLRHASKTLLVPSLISPRLIAPIQIELSTRLYARAKLKQRDPNQKFVKVEAMATANETSCVQEDLGSGPADCDWRSDQLKG